MTPALCHPLTRRANGYFRLEKRRSKRVGRGMVRHVLAKRRRKGLLELQVYLVWLFLTAFSPVQDSGMPAAGVYVRWHAMSSSWIATTFERPRGTHAAPPRPLRIRCPTSTRPTPRTVRREFPRARTRSGRASHRVRITSDLSDGRVPSDVLTAHDLGWQLITFAEEMQSRLWYKFYLYRISTRVTMRLN